MTAGQLRPFGRHAPPLVALLTLWLGIVAADPMLEPRLLVGVNLFPAFLAARSHPPPGTEQIAVVFAEHSPLVDEIAATLRARLVKTDPQVGIRQLPVDELTPGRDSQELTALFIAQPLLEGELRQLLDFSSRHRVLTFSPLVGDVERGVIGGVAISDRILPSLNMGALREHGIELKTFFVKVSDQYESQTPK
jgi:hypothetical protein